MRHTTLAGVAVAGILLYVAEAEAAPHRGYECDEWRDYLFNAETGDFIEWVGKPYWVCKDLGAPVSYPDPPRSPDGGGYGYPHRPGRLEQCARCERRLEQCDNSLGAGARECITRQERLYRRWCSNAGLKRDGSRPTNAVYCRYEIYEERTKPQMVCEGPGIQECVESYARAGVASTRGRDVGTEISLIDLFSIEAGGSTSTTITYPPGTGYVNVCHDAMMRAAANCEARHGECKKAAGGCR